MRKLLTAVLFVLLSINVAYSNPCKPIAKACMEKGYYKGGNNVGKGLVVDCMMPYLNNRKSMNVSMTNDQKHACKMMLEEKMKENKNK